MSNTLVLTRLRAYLEARKAMILDDARHGGTPTTFERTNARVEGVDMAIEEVNRMLHLIETGELPDEH